MTFKRLTALESLLEDSSSCTFRDMATKILACLLLFCAFLDQVTSNEDSSRLQKIKPLDIKITNNGYDILVGVSEEVPQSKMGITIRNLQRIMTAASTELQSITGGRASFSKVTIVVPNTWTNYAYADEETASKANIHVSPLSFDKPEVQLQLRGKGKNRAILLPVDFVETRASDTDVGSVILGSWLKLRYEVDDSYAVLQSDILSDKSCTDAPVKSNICKALLGDFDWDTVITRSIPTYSIIRQRSKRVVMIVDVSGSMFFRQSRIEKVKEGLKQYIINLSDNSGTSLGLVAFSTGAKTLGNLTNKEVDKDNMVNTVATLAEGDQTSIGSGLKEALEVLSRHPEKMNGAEFILISDGEETNQPLINETAPQVIMSNVTVHTIAITSEADSRIDALGAATGGLTFIHREDDQGSDLAIAFQDISNYDCADPAASGIVIFSQRSSDKEYHILIDERIGTNTSFLFECAYKDCKIKIEIDSPCQRKILDYTFSPQSAEVNKRTYKIIPSKRNAQIEILFYEAENGTWTVRTEFDEKQELEIGLTVKSLPKDPLNNPILAFVFWGKDQILPDDCANDQTMYTLITRDNNPVTDAQVLATIHSDQKEYGPYPIYDDGHGSDSYKNDGIYTGDFPNNLKNLTKTERFNLKVTVNGTTATQVKTRQLVAVSPKGLPRRPNNGEKVERLQRFVLGGSFTSMAQGSNCLICEADLVLLVHPRSPIFPLRLLLFRLLEFYITNDKSRVWTGIISVDSTETPEVVTDIARSDRVVAPLTTWQPSGSKNGNVNFAAGLKEAAIMLRYRIRRSVIVLITERGISNVQETLKEARMLRAKGTELISVVVSPTNDQSLVTTMAKLVNDQTKLVTLPNFKRAEEDSITRIINTICGFSLKIPQNLP